MSEQWLIDGKRLFEFLSEQLVKESGAFSKGVNKGLNIARSAVRNPDAVKPIDPETLPIVRQLRAELERVTAQRDELNETCLSLVLLCEKEYRRNNFGMYRDKRNDDLKRLIEEMDAVLNAEKFKSRYRSWVIGRFEKVE